LRIIPADPDFVFGDDRRRPGARLAQGSLSGAIPPGQASARQRPSVAVMHGVRPSDVLIHSSSSEQVIPVRASTGSSTNYLNSSIPESSARPKFDRNNSTHFNLFLIIQSPSASHGIATLCPPPHSPHLLIVPTPSLVPPIGYSHLLIVLTRSLVPPIGYFSAR
jgi:hypothetical protein